MKRLTLLGLMAAGTLYAGSAEAQRWGLDANPVPQKFESPQNFAFELRFSLWRPEVDSDPKLKGTPYKDTFGTASHLAVGAEFDWQALKIPYFGTLGLGASIAHTNMSATAKLAQPVGDTVYSSEETSLYITPMYATLVARMDVLSNKFHIPIVPYGKFGVGLAMWTTGNESGTSNVKGVEGTGLTYGLHYAGGLMLHLNPFDAYSARELDNFLGINHTYLYAEYYVSKLDGFGKSNVLRVGSSSWSFGLVFEM